MKTFIATTFVALAALLATPAAMAAGGSGDLQKANVDVTNQASLQRGARLYMNYCMACHSTQYMRYNRVGRDIGLTEEQVEQNFIFVTDRDGELVNPGSLMTNAMTKEYADEAFGVTPPDLTLSTRIHGEDWVYTFLKSFYIDEDRPLGANNKVFSNVGMPHVLWELQGWQALVEDDDGNERLELVRNGSMTPSEYDRAVRDIVTYLSYMGEPMQLDRQRIGLYVLIFLAVFTLLAYFLKKEYWKDVH
ncbi:MULTISPECIES: cytochrome c1 [unclassified Thioalkalivibrio]|uniref:cytochrome c1 n=1 Tax=unclassified Thioalkalivibrio TaxID=2621013 RepID=UPI00037C5510|nr:MULTISPECIES: cytochrome c1 [unclassified Thioalkalivibrio]